MALNVAKDRTFRHEVSVMTPVDGGHDKETLKATYKVMPISEAERFDFLTTEGTTGFLRAVVVRLEDLVDTNGQPVPYNDQVRDVLFDLPHVSAALVQGYFAGVRGAIKGN